MSFDFDFTVSDLGKMIPGNKYVKEWFESLEKILPDYDINTPERVVAFVAQCAHESANFNVLRENLNYRWESLRKTWPRHFPTDEIAKQYERQPQKIANRAYANRMGNGPESSGDGWRFCGRGLIQLTGRNNYQAFADSIETPIEQIPEYLMTFEGAVQASCWFWETNNLNRWADQRDIVTLSRRINGGDKGLEDRLDRFKKGCNILGI
jgi:putative chitinase